MSTHMRLFLSVIILLAILGSQASAFTDPLDVQALEDLYKSLNQPSLHNWNFNGGDPCDEHWAGIRCSGSSIVEIALRWSELTGNLGSQLHNLQNLSYLDLSFNFIEGGIPRLPSSLRTLELNHNYFSGPLANVFTGLEHLGRLDLTNNSFTGDLPSSFRSLKNIESLYLQNNNFTGSLDCLVGLPLQSLDIRGNDFDEVPEELKSIGYYEIIPEEQELQDEFDFWCKEMNVSAACNPWNEEARELRYRPEEIRL